jgi:hypothetical protein
MPTYGVKTRTWTKVNSGRLMAAKVRFLSREEKSRTK